METESESESCSVVSDSLRSHRLCSPWNSPGQNTGAGSLPLLQGIFPTQGSNPGLPHCRRNGNREHVLFMFAVSTWHNIFEICLLCCLHQWLVRLVVWNHILLYDHVSTLFVSSHGRFNYFHFLHRWIKLLWTFLHMSFNEHIFSVSLG